MTSHQLTGIGDDVDYEDVDAHERWTLALDSDGDLLFSDALNTFRTTSGTQAAKQSLLVGIGTSKGEDPIDEEYGLDLFRATDSIVHLQREIQKTLIYDDHRHERVQRVIDVEVHRIVDRHADVTATVELDTGEVTRLRISVPQ